MAKKKSRLSKLLQKKVLPKLETTFTCPFCDHPDAIRFDMDFKLKVGEACCRICEASYGTKIHRLSEPIDVYTEWLDECHAANGGDDDSSSSCTTTIISSSCTTTIISSSSSKRRRT